MSEAPFDVVMAQLADARIAELKAENKRLWRAIGWLVASRDGHIFVPDRVMAQDFDVAERQEVAGGRTYTSALHPKEEG